MMEKNSKINKARFVLLTGNTKGGIIQYTYEIFKALIELGYDAFVLAPIAAEFHIKNEYKNRIVSYYISKSSNEIIAKLAKLNNENVKSIESLVMSLEADYLWTTDDMLLTMQVGNKICNTIPTIMTIHDTVQHPSYNISIQRRIKNIIWGIARERYAKKANYIVFASDYSRNFYIAIHKPFSDKAFSFPLGAQIPLNKERRPIEIQNISFSGAFFLFFGRIEAYKGIDVLLRTFHISDSKLDLIIAGEGTFPKTEKIVIDNDDRIHIINRFIYDEEMLWLIRHSQAVVLPYKEASQSGVLPIAYYFGKPVITSTVEGLTQFVDDRVTGYICESDQQYVEAYTYYSRTKNVIDHRDDIIKYYNDNLEWTNNLRKLLISMRIMDN